MCNALFIYIRVYVYVYIKMIYLYMQHHVPAQKPDTRISAKRAF